MRRLTDEDLAKIMGSTIKGYRVEAVKIKRGPFTDSDHYGIILGKNHRGQYVTWEFRLLDDGSDKPMEPFEEFTCERYA